MANNYVDLPATGSGPGGGVTSLNSLTGALTLLGGTGITVTPSGSNITIAATGAGAGTVTSVSVVSANGFAGTVANPTSTPALTLTTTITGVLKGNGTAISAATAGTDYVIPSGSITGTAGNITATSNSTLTTLSNLSTVGTIAFGQWVATAIALNHGGTGLTTAPTDGQLLIGSTSGANYTQAAITAGSGVTITNGSGSITISATSGISRTVTSISSATTAAATANTDFVYFVSGTTTITLPTAVSNTNLYTIKNTGSNTVTVATTSSQTIDGSLTAVIATPSASINLVSDTSNWRIV